jgi:hypothetical protein
MEVSRMSEPTEVFIIEQQYDGNGLWMLGSVALPTRECAEKCMADHREKYPALPGMMTIEERITRFVRAD